LRHFTLTLPFIRGLAYCIPVADNLSQLAVARLVSFALDPPAHSRKIAPAAVELGVSRPTLYDLMDKLGIAKE
jgi:hypothetical protein